MLCAVAMGWPMCAPAQPQDPAAPTLEDYVAWSGGTVVPAGQIEIDGRRMGCGAAPTVLDPGYKDFGGSLPGFLILNANRFVGLATPVKLWIFSHECAHQTVGPDEVKADCVAVQRGKREGWLMPAGVAEICEFMRPARADGSHFGGAQRCQLMQQCFSRYDAKRSADGAARRRTPAAKP
jgi:hypothetical protein